MSFPSLRQIPTSHATVYASSPAKEKDRSELGRLYKEARRGGVPVVDASRLATILSALRECLKASDMELRIVELEALLTAEPPGNVVPFKKSA
jgi:hypothetical protein